MPWNDICPACNHEVASRSCPCADKNGYCPCQTNQEALDGGRDCVFVCLGSSCCLESCRHAMVYDGLCATHLEVQTLMELLTEATGCMLSLSEAHHPAARRILKKAKAVTHYSTYAQLRRVIQQVRRKK